MATYELYLWEPALLHKDLKRRIPLSDSNLSDNLGMKAT